MVEAVQTTVSPAGIWAIVIVAVVLLAFWLTAITLADRSQARDSGHALPPGETGPAPDGAWAGGSVPGGRASEIPGEAVYEPIGTGGRHAGEMPAQRAGDHDRAAGSYARPGTPDDESSR